MSDETPSHPLDTDRNLLFGILALQTGLLTREQFTAAVEAWATRKQTPLADILVERGWLTPADREHVNYLVERQVQLHAGDAHAGLATLSHGDAGAALSSVSDDEVKTALADVPAVAGHVLITTLQQKGGRERYSLTRLHATGGIGRVWLARDDELGREVALKELRPETAHNVTLWARFLQEARITGQLEHPGIVPIYELTQGDDRQQLFYTMRFVRGRTLSEAIRTFHA